MASNKA